MKSGIVPAAVACLAAEGARLHGGRGLAMRAARAVAVAVLLLCAGCSLPDYRTESGDLPEGTIAGEFAHCLKRVPTSSDQHGLSYRNTCDVGFDLAHCRMQGLQIRRCDVTRVPPRSTYVGLAVYTYQADTCRTGRARKGPGTAPEWAYCLDDPKAREKIAAGKSSWTNQLGAATRAAPVVAGAAIQGREAARQRKYDQEASAANSAARQSMQSGNTGAAVAQTQAAFDARQRALQSQIRSAEQVQKAQDINIAMVADDRRRKQRDEADSFAQRIQDQVRSHKRGDVAPYAEACVVERPESHAEEVGNGCPFAVLYYPCVSGRCEARSITRWTDRDRTKGLVCPADAEARDGTCYWLADSDT